MINRLVGVCCPLILLFSFGSIVSMDKNKRSYHRELYPEYLERKTKEGANIHNQESPLETKLIGEWIEYRNNENSLSFVEWLELYPGLDSSWVDKWIKQMENM